MPLDDATLSGLNQNGFLANTTWGVTRGLSLGELPKSSISKQLFGEGIIKLLLPEQPKKNYSLTLQGVEWWVIGL